MLADFVQEGLTSWWAPALAFVAGVVSFLSPCVLPLVPGYISYITGEQILDGSEDRTSRRLVPILLFIAGFTLVFVLYGAFAGTFLRLFRGTAGQIIGGTIVVVLGLVMLGYAFGKGPMQMYAERRPFLERAKPGVWGALPLGMAFAAGWTPCVGPVLGGILGIAAGSGSPARGVVLLASYSLGLGVPFLLVGLGVQRMMGAFDWVKRRYRWIAAVSGALLVVVGVLLATGQFTRVVAPLSKFAPGL
jgi:cytochrome c-type biogenesis protein